MKKSTHRKIAQLTAILLSSSMLLSLSACSKSAVNDAIDIGTSIADEFSKSNDKSKTDNDGKNTSTNANTNNNRNNGNTAVDSGDSTWSMDIAPNYYQVVGKAQVDESVPVGTVEYSPVDSLGRPGVGKATINYHMREQGSDRERNMEDPAGWPRKNPKVEIQLDNGKSYRGYMYNRSHQIAKSLGGSDEAQNMVVGTRTQNVGDNQPAGGMAYTETLARDWIDKNKDGHIFYDVTPVFNGDEMLPRYSYVDMKTSDGSIDIRVKVFNAANGYTIDYKTGAFTKN